MRDRGQRALGCRLLFAFLVSNLAVLATAPAAATPAAEPAVDAAAEADEATRHRKPWRYRRFGPVDYSATGVLVAGYLTLELVVPRAEQATWEGPALFDGPVRDGVRLRTRSGRATANVASDIAALVPLALVATDAGLAFGQHGQTGLHVLTIDAQVFSLAGILTRGIQIALPRARPDVAECERDEDYSNLCFKGEYEDFPSGHAATAAAAAGLVCAHHKELELYGNPAADLSACATAATSALATGVLRMMADRHYASDVATGLVLGGTLGYVLPELWHYRQPKRHRGSEANLRPTLFVAVLPSASSWPTVEVWGTF